MRGAGGPGAHHARRSPPTVTVRRARAARHRRDRRRAADVQRLDDRGADRRRRRLHGGQARQPVGHRAVGLGRRAGGAGGADRPDAGGGGAVHRGGRLRLHVRARPSPGDPLRHPRPVRSWRCARSSTSSARSPTRRGRRGSSSASRTPPTWRRWRARWPCWAPSTPCWSSSHDGLDELSISAPTRVVEVVDGEISTYDVAPADVGLKVAPAESVPGGDPAENADTARRIFAGEAGPPPRARPGRAQRRGGDLRRGWCARPSPRGRGGADAVDSGAAASGAGALRDRHPAARSATRELAA